MVLFHAHDIFWSASFGETEKAERKKANEVNFSGEQKEEEILTDFNE